MAAPDTTTAYPATSYCIRSQRVSQWNRSWKTPKSTKGNATQFFNFKADNGSRPTPYIPSTPKMHGSIAAVTAGIEEHTQGRPRRMASSQSRMRRTSSEADAEHETLLGLKSPLRMMAGESGGEGFLVARSPNPAVGNSGQSIRMNSAASARRDREDTHSLLGLGISEAGTEAVLRRLTKVRLNVEDTRTPTFDSDSLDEDDSEWEHDSVVETTILESYLEELIRASDHMTAWRARIFLLLNAGNIIPFKMMDIHLVSAAYLCLSPEQHDRFAQLGLYTPLSVAKLILRSKLQSAFFLIILLLSIALLCVETDPALTSINFHTIFILECICMVVFVVEICIQLCCIQRKPAQTLRSFMPRFMRKAYRWYLMIHTITFSEKKVQRVITGRDPTPKVFRMDKKCENEQTTGADFSHHSFDRTHLVSPAETSAPPLVYVDSEAKLWTWIFIDIVATLPFFVEVFLNVALTVGSGQTYDWMLIHMYSWRTASDWFFLLRIMRTFRLFKIGQKSERVRIIWRAVTNSLDGIVLLLLTVPLFVLFSSFFLFYAEQASSYVENGVWYYSNGTSSSFQSVADCFWILIETITTVGYGDVIPHTVGGKLVCAIVMFFSLFIVAFPLCMITMQYSHYARLFSEQKRARAEAVHRLHEKLLAADGDVVFKATSASPPGGKGGVDTTLEPFSETPLEALYTNFNQLTSRSLAKIMSFGDARNTSSGSLRTLGALGNIGEAEAPVAPAARRTPLKIVSLFQEPHATSPNAEAAKTAEELPSAGVTTAAGLRKASLGPEPPSPRDEIGPVAQGEPAVRKPKSYPSMREIERQVDNVVLEGHPKTVLFKVQDWKLDYKEERREDMLTMRVRCKDEDAYRRLMKILADFS